jgi:4-amino-4-deoxy-L-arabinose transferase-like glycosyltransferase
VILRQPTNRRIRVAILATIACIFFFLAGLAIAPLLGIEADETLFVQAIYSPRAELYAVRIGHASVPLMLMNYVGALKSWLYPRIFHSFGAGVITLRIPMVLAGTLSIWLFFLLLRRIAGERAAVVGCTLLAVDSAYLLTLCFDWGPVALQHLLLIGGMLAVLKFYQEKNDRLLAAGFFLFGLALWDKALAVWMLSGLGVATVLVFPRQLLGRFNRRRLAIGALAFVLGALPLLVYNARHHWVTFAGNFHRDTSELAGKLVMLRNTAEGQGLFGWLTAEDWQTPKPRLPSGPIERASADISALAGHPRRHLLLYGFVLALLLAPWAGQNGVRAIVFALITMAVTWIQMAITANAGGSAHHTILLWPFPELVIAVSFAAASRRIGRAGIPALTAVLALMLISGALVTNEYYALAVRNGGAQSWSNAVFPLSQYLKKDRAKTIYCMDWGILDPLRLMNRGSLPLAVGTDQVGQQEISPADRAILARMISDPANLFISHTKGFEFFPAWNPRLIQIAAASGYQRELETEISDPFGRPVFDLYRFRRASGPLPETAGTAPATTR